MKEERFEKVVECGTDFSPVGGIILPSLAFLALSALWKSVKINDIGGAIFFTFLITFCGTCSFMFYYLFISNRKVYWRKVK